jgi:hypothetical protein
MELNLDGTMCSVCGLYCMHWHCKNCKIITTDKWSMKKVNCDMCCNESRVKKSAKIKLCQIRSLIDEVKNQNIQKILEFILRSLNVTYVGGIDESKEDIIMIINNYFDNTKKLPLFGSSKCKIDITKSRKRKMFDKSNSAYIRLINKQNELLKKNKFAYDKRCPIISSNFAKKHELLNTVSIYNKYKNNYLVDIYYYDDTGYIQWLITHNWELDTNKERNWYGTKKKVIKKKKKVESEYTKIFRYILGIPKYPCEKLNCKNNAVYGKIKRNPFRCEKHKLPIHEIVIQTECRGVDGICPYGCKKGNVNYDNYCTYCFCHLFPNDKRTKNIRQKTKEMSVVNHVCTAHEG